ncbi:MAG TPA: hypothetical protein VG055_10345 [Planctomycetaceae bacterium]|nr:hypothetical protein [Planctomycetaceae bacterium]
MRIFVFLDTNILIRIATQGKPGCEQERWRELHKLVADSRVTIIVPEIVRLEFEKFHDRFLSDFHKKLEKFGANVKALVEDEKPYWNEMTDLLGSFRQAVGSSWGTMKTEKVADCQHGCQIIERWFRDGNFQDAPFSERVLLRAKQWLVAGRVPPSKDPANDERTKCERLLDGDNDLCIIESLIAMFEQSGTADAELLFCTENIPDFGLEAVGDGEPILHPKLRDGLPKTKLFTNLGSLVQFVHDNHPVEEPKPEDVERALQAEAARPAYDGPTTVQYEFGRLANPNKFITTTTPPPDDNMVWVPVLGGWQQFRRGSLEHIQAMKNAILLEENTGKRLGD